MDGPVILCGLGRLGRRVLECLRRAGLPVVVIDQQVMTDDPKLPGVRVLVGDFRDRSLLIEAGVTTSRGVLILSSNDLVNFSTTLMVRQLAPEVRVVLRLFNQNLLNRLGKTLSNVIPMSVSALASPLLALSATTGDVLGTFAVGNDRFQVAEFLTAEPSPLIGRTVAEVNQLGQYLLIAHQVPDQPTSYLREIALDHRIQSGERLTLAALPAELKRLQPQSHGIVDDVLWAGKLRRIGRIAYRTFAEMDLAVKICTITLTFVVLVSASTYHWGLGLGWADGVYRTISVIATGAELGAADYEGWGKVFVSGLRIFGTVLVAAFTAILTNYLIRARFGGVFEVRRIPDGGHVVVVGLGNVGFRVVEELVKLKEQVVVIEIKADQPLVNRCRRLGVPVIIGDATLPEVLKISRFKQARAMICVTGDDLLNLEIALLVSEGAKLQRVVVRLADSTLAETTRSVSVVKLALSLPDLAAPAFAAALVGDRVASMFESGGRTLAVVEINITEKDEHHFLGRSIKALAIDYGFLPVAVFDDTGAEKEYRNSLQTVSVGERLLVIIPISELDRLNQRLQPDKTCSVWIESFPLSSRGELKRLLQQYQLISAEDAEQILEMLPVRLVQEISQGTAEELVDVLQREKMAARVENNRPMNR